jgi:hypothetical protein
VTWGNGLFLAGAAMEVVGLAIGVDSAAVAWSLIGYGAVLLVTGYLS